MSTHQIWSPSDGRGHSVHLIRHVAAAVIELRLGSPAAPTFAIPTLDALGDIFDMLCAEAASGDEQRFRYLHLTSASAAVFSMGGDLQTIAELARARNKTVARDYGRKAAQVIHRLYEGLGIGMVTTACVDGKAFGAGFEAVLACNRAVARRGASFCLPESRFGLFPGMGATSLLSRRLGQTASETLMRERTVITAEDAVDRGLVDAVVDGEPATLETAAAASGGEARWARLRDEAEARRRREGFTLDEVMGTTADWAERVVSMTPADLQALERVAKVQQARRGASAA